MVVCYVGYKVIIMVKVKRNMWFLIKSLIYVKTLPNLWISIDIKMWLYIFSSEATL